MKKPILAALLLMVACTLPNSPAQDVYAAENAYAAGLEIELTYDALPACGQPTSPVLCSTAAIKKKVRTADDIAYAALKNAEVAVRTPGFAADATTTAVASAQAAIGAFTSITATLGVK